MLSNRTVALCHGIEKRPPTLFGQKHRNCILMWYSLPGWNRLPSFRHSTPKLIFCVRNTLALFATCAVSATQTSTSAPISKLVALHRSTTARAWTHPAALTARASSVTRETAWRPALTLTSAPMSLLARQGSCATTRRGASCVLANPVSRGNRAFARTSTNAPPALLPFALLQRPVRIPSALTLVSALPATTVTMQMAASILTNATGVCRCVELMKIASMCKALMNARKFFVQVQFHHIRVLYCFWNRTSALVSGAGRRLPSSRPTQLLLQQKLLFSQDNAWFERWSFPYTHAAGQAASAIFKNYRWVPASFLKCNSYSVYAVGF